MPKSLDYEIEEPVLELKKIESQAERDKYRKRRYKTLGEKARSLRRQIILQMMMENPKRAWPVREIAAEARKHPWFVENMPNYSYNTAHQDLLVIRQETKERRAELAETILVDQLDQLDDQISEILADFSALGSLEEFMEAEPEITAIERFINSKTKLTNALIRLQDRQAKLVPEVEVPKRLEIASTSINLDTYLEVRKTYKNELEPPKKQLKDGDRVDIVEGDYEET